MGNIIVGIHQPNFMPWLGYFYKIWQSDIFIFLDDAQFQKTGSNYTNRVSIIINHNKKNVTLPVKRVSGTSKINEVKINNQKWKEKIWKSIQSSYGKAPFFYIHKELIFELILYETDNLAEYNMNFIRVICNELYIKTKLITSSTFDIRTTSTQRLVNLIQCVNGNIYLSGSGGDNYQNNTLYRGENIKLIYNKVPMFKYSQLRRDDFISGLSIIDAIFNIGMDELRNNFFSRGKIDE